MPKKPGKHKVKGQTDAEKVLEDIKKGPKTPRDPGPIGMTEDERRERQAHQAEETYARIMRENEAWEQRERRRREQAEEEYRLNHRTGEYFGKITATSGRVYIKSKDDGKWHVAKPGQIVLKDDVLMTDEGSSIMLQTNDGGLKMGSRTSYKPGGHPEPNRTAVTGVLG